MLIPMLPTPPHGAAPGTDPAYAGGTFHLCAETGNYWVVIPGHGDDIMWTCHLDTVGIKPEPVTLVQRGHMLHSDGTTVLGADDKAGVAILCMMIRAGVPGTYAFFVGEESGCIGSKDAADEYRMHHDRAFRACISLDRKGSSDVITHQLGERCCSDAWAKALADGINRYMVNGSFSPCSQGVFTDSASYMDCIDQCTNLSVGYHGQHGNTEHIDMQHAYELSLALIRMCRSDGVPDLPRDEVSAEFHQTADKINALEAKVNEMLGRWEELPEGDERDDIEIKINDTEWDIEELKRSLAEEGSKRYDSSRFNF
jgi:hypothetical protein